MAAESKKKFHETRVFRILLFLLLWLMVGFTTGTSVLIGPVRWLAALGRSQGWAAGTEDVLAKTIIVLFVAASFFISLWLSRTVKRSPKLHVKIAVPALASLFALASLYLWLNPRLAGSDVVIRDSKNSQFTFGPYPEEADLKRLRQEGYTAVISLLHPAVVPFEPVLQEEEERAAERVGIRIIHLPMLPWVSENKEVLDSVRSLASSGKGRYYVHCYLGKDRVNVVRRVVESVGAGTASTGESSSRSLAGIASFERGPVIRLEEDVWLVPYPSDEEWFGYILAGQFKTVLSLLDPANPDDTLWITKERELAEVHGLTFEITPVSSYPFLPEQVLHAVSRARSVEKPVVIHAFLHPSPASEAFLQAYRSGNAIHSPLPPLPPSLFVEPMQSGKVEVIAPNVAVGPRPQGAEFGAYLYQRGVRSFICIGSEETTEASQDQIITREAGLSWQVLQDSSALFAMLASDGPYYLYGPGLAALKEIIASRFGPAIPDSITYVKERPQTVPGIQEQGEAKPPGVIGFVGDFLKRALPGPKMIILLSPLLLFYASISGWFAGWLRVKRNVRAPYTRKVFHFLIFTMAAVLQLTLGLPAVVLFGILVSLAVVYAVIRGKGYMFYEAMARPTDEPHRTLFVIIPLLSTALGGVIANLFFNQYSAVGYLIAGWGDAVGEPVGARWGKHRYKVPSLGKVKATRSIEGSLAIFLLGTLVGFLGLLLLGIPALTALWVAAVAGLVGAVVEAFSNHGIDNLTVQVAVAAVAWLLLK